MFHSAKENLRMNVKPLYPTASSEKSNVVIFWYFLPLALQNSITYQTYYFSIGDFISSPLLPAISTCRCSRSGHDHHTWSVMLNPCLVSRQWTSRVLFHLNVENLPAILETWGQNSKRMQDKNVLVGCGFLFFLSKYFYLYTHMMSQDYLLWERENSTP